ncbi:Alcohol acetyltransferase [Cordyceps fumosorosea ARSEF 2679]|uniref:Alcohol acetyltransferase n=1 Tax=Cordyceps fumosorosea (strain ARSEF 2679) TaxID=1081104 RepID=A0A167MPT1_CORFA|nr:Alcohol acetyltransferase [Cordyceps fumosorosea ARSEF 2679]OAA54621.1 Alcohol acetyltransferase [Cordyceps fumosorosea ARSEF 2679]
MAQSKPNSGYIVEYVEEMESLGLDEYGFNLMRTYYQDDDLWQAFRRNFDTALEKGMAGEWSRAIEKLHDKVFTRIHDDLDLAGQGPEGVSAAFQTFCLDEEDEDEDEDEEEEDDEGGDDEEERDKDKGQERSPWSHEMGPGIIRSICLMVDEASMRSATPYVIAVDALLHTGADLGYPGYFKIAIDCLMPKFYAAVGRFDLARVAAAVDKDVHKPPTQQRHRHDYDDISTITAIKRPISSLQYLDPLRIMPSENAVLRRLGPMELWSSSRHSLGIYRAVTVSARYVPSSRSPGGASVTSISPRLLAALVAVHVSVVVVAAAEDAALDREVARVQAAQHNALWQDTETRAPWRLTIVRDEQHNYEDVIFAFHQALLDGTSGRAFHEHLLAALNNSSPPGDDDSGVLSFPEPPALPEPQEEAVRFTLGPLYVASVLWGEFAPAMLKRRPPGAAAASPSRSHTPPESAPSTSSPRRPARYSPRAAQTRRPSRHSSTRSFSHTWQARFRRTRCPAGSAPPPQSACGGTCATTWTVPCETLSACFSARPTTRFPPRTFPPCARRRALSRTALTGAVWATARRVRGELADRRATHNIVAGMMHHVSDWRRLHTARGGGGLGQGYGEQGALFSNGAMVTGAAVGVNVASAPGGRLSIALSWQDGVVEEALVEGLGLALEGMVNRFCEGGREWSL